MEGTQGSETPTIVMNVDVTDPFTVQDGKQDPIEIELGELRQAQLVFVALNHKLRRKMLRMLDSPEHLTVTDIYVRLRLEQSTASQHLAKLRRAGLVTTVRQGRNIIYSINKQRLRYLAGVIEKLNA